MALHPPYPDDVFEEVLNRIALGQPLAEVSREPGMPAVQTVYDWIEKADDRSVRFARAREAGFDMLAVEALQAARNGANNPQHAKVVADTILKLLAKWSNRYAENVQVRHADFEGKNLRDMSESEAATKVASMLEAVRRRAIPLLSDEGESSED